MNTGYLWDNALRANLTVRNYGFFIDTTLYSTAEHAIPPVRDPFADGLIVAYPANVSLAPHTDMYFRGFDNVFPDYYRYKEWEREFDTKYAYGGLPALSLVRFMHDHTGNFVARVACPIPGYLMLFIAQVMAQLTVEHPLHQRRRQFLHQPVRTDQAPAARRDQLVD